MATRHQFVSSWWTAVGFSLMAVGCSTTPKNPLANDSPQPTTTAVSGAGTFASNDGPKHPDKVYLAHGQWQEQMGNLAEARDSYGKVLADHPKDIEALLGMARLDQGAGLMDDAEARLKKAYKYAPKDPRVLATYGNFYAAQENWPKSIDKLQAAVKLAPDDSRYQFLLAVALARSGDVEKAKPYFIRSVGEAQANFNIGYILLEKGERDASERYLIQALALKPDLEQAQEMLDRIHHRPQKTMLAKGSNAADAPVNGVRMVPVQSVTEQAGGTVPANSQTQPTSYSLPPTTDSSFAQPPAGLTPSQLEQWRNQQGQ